MPDMSHEPPDTNCQSSAIDRRPSGISIHQSQQWHHHPHLRVQRQYPQSNGGAAADFPNPSAWRQGAIHMADQTGVIGFNLFVGSQRLNQHVIGAHARLLYRCTVRGVCSTPLHDRQARGRQPAPRAGRRAADHPAGAVSPQGTGPWARSGPPSALSPRWDGRFEP